jgi:hypothetical protein
MSGYDYVNGVFGVHTDIMPGFKRFRSCNAQWREIDSEDGKRRVWQFVSYATPIMQISNVGNFWRILINESAFDYSCSTSRQIRWFCVDALFPFDSSDLRQAIEKCKPCTPGLNTFWPNENVCIDVCNKETLSRKWEN